MCDELLEEAGLTREELGNFDALVFGRGPGTFTGVRIAAAAVQGAAYAHRLPVIAVSDLAAIAQKMLDECDEERGLAVMDARMGEVYYGHFLRNADDLAEADGAEGVAAPERIPGLTTLPRQSYCIGGSGLLAYPALSAGFAAQKPQLLPHAGVMLKLAIAKFEAGETLTPEQAQPVYLRNKVV